MTVVNERQERQQSAAGGEHATGASLHVLALRGELDGQMREIGAFPLGDLSVQVCEGRESIWAIIRRPGRGGVAVRAGHVPGGFSRVRRLRREPGEALRLEAESPIGIHRIVLGGSGADLQRIRVQCWLTPAEPLLVPFLPRDLYPLDENDDPLGTSGRVEAAQRGPNTGLIFLSLEKPAFGQLLYVQDLTALNDYFRATHTSPMGAVGGEWPELGYLPPTPPQSGTPPVAPLPAGVEVMLSDASLVLRDAGSETEQEKAHQFIQMLGEVYCGLRHPEVIFRDWRARAEQTLKDLDKAPVATCTSYGHRYIRPYTDAEYPDSMVQMTVTTALYDYARWQGKPVPLAAEFAAGMEKFFDPKLKTLRRYLPNVGKDKDADAVDSWYLYHPLRNLAQLALNGEDWARDLFLRSVEYGIRAARHFNYLWPIQYNVQDFSVATEKRGDEVHGQTDVGGFYAYVMLLGFELTGEQRFLDEAKAAIDAAQGMRFELEYQANLTAWGAAACMRLWRITGKAAYREQGYVYLASFLHNCEIWESRIERAEHYSNFFGATALQDAPYMAMYECFDSFAAFERFLMDGGSELLPAARMLASEYCKYVLHRGWYYYPDTVPADIIADEFRNGHVDRTLSFPVEDLYADGQPMGQVGQEIYGAGAAFVLASRAFHRVTHAPFDLYCNHFLVAEERVSERAMGFSLVGGDSCTALLSVVQRGRAILPVMKVATGDGDTIRPALSEDARIEYHVPANGRVVLTWSDQ